MNASIRSKTGPIAADPSQFLVHYRRGRLLGAARGGTAFCLPFLDRCILVPGTAHQVEFRADQVTAENQGIEVSGFAVWRVQEPLKACAAFDFSDAAAAVLQVHKVLQGVVESATRHQVAVMHLHDVLRQRAGIMEALKKEVGPLCAEWGLVLDTIEIRTVKILSQHLFENLQAAYRDQARLAAGVSALETERALSEQRFREDVLRMKAELETRAAAEELALRQARHEAELAAIRAGSERLRIENANTRDRLLTALDRLPEVAAALPLRHIDVRSDLLSDLLRAASSLSLGGAQVASSNEGGRA